MSSFDKRVCQWLNTASIPPKSKLTILNRMSVGIINYQNLELEKLTTVPVVKMMGESGRIDYSLQDHITKAIYRLEDGDTSEGPLFQSAPVVPKLTAPHSKGSSRQQSQERTEEKREKEPHHQKRKGVEENNGEENLATFTFGATADETPFGSSPTQVEQDEGDDIDAGEIDEGEDNRRRLLQRQNRNNAVSAAPLNIDAARSIQLRKVPKSAEIISRLTGVLSNHHLFAHLEDSDVQAVADAMEIVNVSKGTSLGAKGAISDKMFVVVAGSVVVKETAEKINVGGTFGDVGLLYDLPSASSFEAASNDTQVCSFDRVVYQSVCSRASQDKRERYEGFLAGVETLKMLTPAERLQIADGLKTVKYAKGEKLISFGEDGNWFFLIAEGTVDVVGRDEAGNPVQVCSFHQGHPIGELEILHKHKNVADCIAASDTVRVARMTARHFERVIGSAKEFLERQAQDDEVYAYYRQKRKSST